MTINYTTLLGLALPVTGTESGTWGDDVSLGITDYLDIAVAGTNNITNDSDITLSITNGSSAGSNIVASPNSTTAQYMQLLCTGSRTAIRNINCPESSKMYVVSNSTSGGYAIVVRGYTTGPSYTTGVTIANGEKCVIFWSSVSNDFIKITSSIITNLTGTLGTTNGGTGLTSFTANGVVYASSTSALATGSALTFDGTNLGIGTSSPAYKLDVNGVGRAQSRFIVGPANDSSDRMFYVSGTAPTSGSSQYGVVINPTLPNTVSSAAYGFYTNLNIASGATVTNAFGLYVDALSAGSSTITNKYGLYVADTNNSYIGGSLGLGVTPSAWNTGKVMQIGSGAADLGLFCNNNDANISSNAYYNSGWKYQSSTSVAASRYQQTNGTHVFYNAVAGTAGNAISFTQAMTLDASGRLLVSTTSSTGTNTKLVVGAGLAGANGVIVANTANGTYSGLQVSNWTGSTTTNGPYIGFDNSSVGSWAIGSGNGVNTFDFCQTWGTPLARIDASGNLLVGTTTANFNFSSGWNILLNSGASYTNTAHASGTSSGAGYASFVYNSGIIGSITQNGTTGVLYNLTSDYRLKNNQQPLTGAKDFIMALKPKKWQWWDGSGEGVGFVAHEFMEVAKYSGHGEKDAVDADGKPVYQSIQPSSSEVMANLVSFIQEQQALIESLTKRLADAGIA